MSKYIIKRANELIKKQGTRDPIKIIHNLGIELMYDSSFKKLKGFYTIMNRQPYIVMNANLDENKTKIVAAHELGHHILHKKMATKKILQEFKLYDMNIRSEYEANCFAAELLISDDEILDLIKKQYDMQQIAALLCTDINMVGIKLGNMNTCGKQYNIGVLPKGDFLKN